MDDEDDLLRPKDVLKYLNISASTLCRWGNEGKLQTVKTKGGKSRYYKKEIIAFRCQKEGTPIPDTRKKFCYCRVSTSSQKDDLMRQIDLFRNQYPEHTIITDIGSGLNFKRKGLNTILDSAISGDLFEVVVTHKDRLCRFGFDLIERIITRQNGKILVLDQRTTSPREELCSDLISIITVFSARMYGLRSHSIKNKIKEILNTDQDTKGSFPSNSGRENTDTIDDGTISMVL